MRQALTKLNSSCYVFVNVKFNGVLKYAGTVKIEGLTLLRNANHEGVDTVLVTVDH